MDTYYHFQKLDREIIKVSNFFILKSQTNFLLPFNKVKIFHTPFFIYANQEIVQRINSPYMEVDHEFPLWSGMEWQSIDK